jgi:hypothetical protein
MTAPNGIEGTKTPSRTPRSGTPSSLTHLNALNNKSHKIKEKQGYKDTRFHGKEEQFRLVVKTLLVKGFIPNELVENEVVFNSSILTFSGTLVLYQSRH